VLIVDDNHDAADMLGDFLTIVGHDVRVVYDGRDAIDALHEFGAQVVLIDIGLPVIDGWEIARRLREIHEPPRLCIIAVTGYGEDRDRQRSRSAGIDHHLVKPPDLVALESLMQGSANVDSA
jgi:DNA-binding response OmpR family regulator